MEKQVIVEGGNRHEVIARKIETIRNEDGTILMRVHGPARIVHTGHHGDVVINVGDGKIKNLLFVNQEEVLMSERIRAFD